MTSAAFGRKVAVVAFLALSLIATAVGWVLIQFDDQYESSSVTERVLVGVFGGALGALIVSPVSAFASAITGAGAARFHRKRTPPLD
jgi:hypothetical protein